MESLKLNASRRTVTGKQVKGLRRQGIIPGIIYGYGIEPIAVQFAEREIARSIRSAGSSTTVMVTVEGQAQPLLTIFRDVQYDPIRREVIHLDLQALDINETVRVPVSVVLTGESPAVVDFGGVLIHVLNEVEVEALPTALVPAIEVDISGIKEFGQSITVGDIELPEGITILNDAQDTVVIVNAPEAEEELATGAEEEGAEVEVIGEKPAEEAEA